MRIVIVGPGALGSLLAARLFLLSRKNSQTGNDSLSLSMLDYKSERADYINRNGLLFQEGERISHCHPAATTNPEIVRQCEALFLCVKTTAVTSALARIAPFVSAQTLLIAMQNGIGHINDFTSINCLRGVGITSEGATLIQAGHVRHGGSGLTRLGLLDQESDFSLLILQKTSAVLNAAGIQATVTHDPLRHIWAKLFVNVGINALSAIHRCPNGELLNSSSIRNLMKLAVREAESVAKAKKITITEDPVETTFKVCKTTANNISSMHQDVINQRPTEIDAINGAVVAAGKELGIAVPVNIELVRQIREIEASYSTGNRKKE